MNVVRKLLELIRFSHTVFALPFAGLACVFAICATPSVEWSALELAKRLIGVLLCMVTARSAAMAFNRLVDARIDAQNPRTADRHIPAGSLSVTTVWTFWGLMSLAFVGSCLLFLPNWLPIAFSIPVLAWICGYSLAKRFTSGAHLWLGAALALSPICAWIALRGEVVIANPSDVWPAVVLGAAILFWVAGFDIIYACQDADYDRGAGLNSVPARFGIAGALRIAAGLHLVMLVTLAGLPIVSSSIDLAWIYYLALLFVIVLVIRQHMLVRPDDLRRVGIAFFNINAFISLGFCALAALDAFL